MYGSRKTIFLICITSMIIALVSSSFVSADPETEDSDILSLIDRNGERIRIVDLLADAETYVLEKDYVHAREAADEILQIDPANREAKDIILNIEEKSRISYGSQDPAIMDVLEKTRQKIQVAEFLSSAQGAIRENDYLRAESAVYEVLTIDPDNQEAKDFLKEINNAKEAGLGEGRSGLTSVGYGSNSVGFGEDEIPEAASSVKAPKKRSKIPDVRQKISRYEIEKRSDSNRAKRCLEEAEEFFVEGDYGRARQSAKEAQALDPENPLIMSLISKIDKNEIFETREKKEYESRENIKKAAKESETEVYTAHDEGKSWARRIGDVFRGKTYELGDVEEGKVYSIDECVQIALRNSPRFGVAEKQIKMAELKIWKARREILPEITGRYEASSGKIGADQLPRHYRGNKYAFELKQNIFDGMEKWFALRQAKTNLDIAQLEKAQMENEVIEEAKKAYYSLDKAIKSYVVQVHIRDKVGAYWDVVDKIHREELVAEVEYLKVRGQYMQADFQVLSSDENISLAEMVLFQSMGMEPMGRIKIKPVERPEDPLSIGLENCYELALANKPEFQIKAKTIEYYEFERKIKKAKGWPKVDFNGSFGASYENYEPLSIAADYNADASGPARSGRRMEAEWYAGVKTSIPFWGNTIEHNYVREQWAPTVSAFRGTQSATNYLAVKFLDDMDYFTNLEESRIGFERAKYEYDKAKKDLMVGVKELYFKYRKALIQMDISGAQVEYQRDYVAVLEEKQRLGDMEVSRVIEELEKLSEHEYGLIQADADYYISIAGLNKAIGIPEYFKPGYENVEYEEWKRDRETAVGKNSPEEYNTYTADGRAAKIRLAEQKRREKKIREQ